LEGDLDGVAFFLRHLDPEAFRSKPRGLDFKEVAARREGADGVEALFGSSLNGLKPIVEADAVRGRLTSLVLNAEGHAGDALAGGIQNAGENPGSFSETVPDGGRLALADGDGKGSRGETRRFHGELVGSGFEVGEFKAAGGVREGFGEAP